MDRRAGAAAATALAALLVLSPTSAEASCAEGSGPSGSPVVFVGTVDGQRGGFTRLAVDEVWAGPDLAPEVWLLTGQRGRGVSGSTDADLTDGARYVVGASQDFSTDACSITDVVRGHAVHGRPASVRDPTAAGSEGADPPPGPLGWAGRAATWVVGPLIVLYGLVSLRRRRRRLPQAESSTAPG